MNLNRINIHRLKLVLKFSLSILCFLAFILYTVPAYDNVRAFVNEKMFPNKKTIIIGENPLKIEVAKTEAEREKGLSGRYFLEEDEGMLFVFEKKGQHNFWMKDMNFDIDIIWFNEYGEIIYFVQGVTADSYPKLFGPPQDSMSVLEVHAGYIKKNGLKIGDKIDLY